MKIRQSSTAERIARVTAMEARMEQAAEALALMEAALPRYEAAQEQLRQLSEYMAGDWLSDYDADAAGELPGDLKRGVLSQDALDDLFADVRRLRERLQALLREGR